MYSLFEILFQKSYWAMLLRGATWSEVGRSVRRVHKDKRARKHVGRFALHLLIPVLCGAYLAWLAGTGALMLVPFVIPVLWWRQRRAKQDSVPLSIAPSNKPVDPVMPEGDQRALRHHFAEMAVVHAVFLSRAGSEAFLKQKVLPEGFEVTSRRVQLEVLRQHELWEKISLRDREALTMADGHWEWAQINSGMLSGEKVRLLRWILRMDFFLPVLGQQLAVDFRLGHEILNAPQKVIEGKDLVDLPMLRIGRDAAQIYNLRCYAEAVTRGYLDGVSPEAEAWARGYAAAHAGKQHEDQLLEDKIVSEASEDTVKWALTLARIRLRFLEGAIALLDGTRRPNPWLGGFPDADPPAEEASPQEEVS